MRSFDSCLGGLAVCLWALAAAGVAAQTPSPPASVPAKPVPRPAATLPQRNMTLELRAIAESAPEQGSSQSWGTALSDGETWQKVTVANGERAQLAFSTAQAWVWTEAAVRGNGTGSVEGVSQRLQWTSDGRMLECLVAWGGGSKPARLEVSVQVAAGGAGMEEGTAPKPRTQQVRTLVWVPLGAWFTLARSGPRPLASVEGRYSSHTAEQGEAQLLQVRVLAPD